MLQEPEPVNPQVDAASLLNACWAALCQFPATALKVLVSPRKFFEVLASEDLSRHKLAKATVFLIVCAVLSVLSNYSIAYQCGMSECLDQLIQKSSYIIGMNYAFAIGMHLILRLFGSRGNLLDTVESANYCSAQYLLICAGNMTKVAVRTAVPSTGSMDSLLQWFVYCCVEPSISLASLFVPLYGCWIFSRGIRACRKISRVKTSVAIFGPVILFFAPMMLAAALTAVALGMMTRHQ